MSFLSIGTNDLVQYALAVDRGNPDVGYLHNPVHPAILRMLQQVVDAGRAAGIPVSVCGEMAGEPAYALLLLGLGADELSMSGTSVPTMKHLIRLSSTADGREMLEQALSFDVADEVDAYLRAEMARRFPDVCSPPAPAVPMDDLTSP